MIIKNLLTLGVLCVFFVSCGGQKPMVENVAVTTDQIDGDIYVGLDADLSIGAVQLPSATIPILVPKTGKEIGLLTMGLTLEGKNRLSVDINMSELVNIDLNSATLPNGSALPLIGSRPVIVVPLGKGVEVYISLTQDSAAIGVSVPIRTFDSIGAKVGTAAVMPIFNINNILGAAGVYTSKTAGENGFALVADLSGAIGQFIANKSLDDHMSRMPQLQKSDDSDAEVFGASRSQKKRIDSELLKLHRKRKQLQLH